MTEQETIAEQEIQTKRIKKLHGVAEAWYEQYELLQKQIEKACYAGVAIIWIFIVPVYSSDFNGDFQKFTFDFWPLIVSLVLFIAPLVIILSMHLVDLRSNRSFYKKSVKLIEEGKDLLEVHLVPSRRDLRLSYIIYALVLIGYLIIGFYVFSNII